MKVLFHRITGKIYGQWTDEEWKSAPVSKELDGTYRIRNQRDWSINVHLPLELFDGPKELGPDDPANENELINAMKSARHKVDEDGKPRHTIKLDSKIGLDAVHDAKDGGWEEYLDEEMLSSLR